MKWDVCLCLKGSYVHGYLQETCVNVCSNAWDGNFLKAACMFVAGGCLEGRENERKHTDKQNGGLVSCLPAKPATQGFPWEGMRAELQFSPQHRVKGLLHGRESWSSDEKAHSTFFSMQCQSKEKPGHTPPHWPEISQLGYFLPFTLHCGLRDFGNWIAEQGVESIDHAKASLALMRDASLVVL